MTPEHIAEVVQPFDPANGMPDLGSIFEMARQMADQSNTKQPAKPQRKRKFVGGGAAVFSVVTTWATVALASPLVRAGHSIGNFFVHDPAQAAVAIVVGLLSPRFTRRLARKVLS